jgi:hypothetical protein
MNKILLPSSDLHAPRHSALWIRLVVLCAALLLARVCAAQTPTVVTLTFEGLQDDEPVLNYYAGGYGGFGSGPGPNYGITFGPDSLALVSTADYGTGYFSGNPSGDTIVFFNTGGGVIMNVAQGFSNGFSFYYSASLEGTVVVYDGLNATGNVLATIVLPVNIFPSDNCPIAPQTGLSSFCVWQQSNNSFTGTARSVDFAGSIDTIGFDNIAVGADTATLTITTPSVNNPSILNGTVGVPYNFQPVATGGTLPYTWTAGSSGSETGLPRGLTVTNGAISGTPTAAGTYTFSLTVTDSTVPTPESATLQPVTLVINQPSLTVICNPQSETVTPGTSYTAVCTASGGIAPYNWAFLTLPSWLKSSGTPGAATITLSGTVPSAPPNSYSVGVTVTDSTTPANLTATTTVTINLSTLTVVCNPQSGTYPPGATFTTVCTASGGTAPYNWSFPNLPSWLKSSVTTGAVTVTLTGTVPSAPPNSYSVTVTITDSTTPTKVTASTTVTINLTALTVVCNPQSGTYAAGAQYSTACTASGGTAPYNWTFATLPAWLKSSATSGAAITLSGTVPAPPPTSYSVTATVTDSTAPTKQTASVTVTINLASTPPQLTCNPITGPVMVGSPYTSTCTASSGTPGYTFSISAGALPSGMKAAAAATTYTISGKPGVPGAYNYTVQVKDSAGQLATQSFSGTISPAPSVGSFTLTAVTSVTNQYTANLTLSNAPPAALSGTLCLAFSADPAVANASAYQSQEVVFANGTTSAACSSALKTTLAFTIPAGSTAAVWSGNSSQFSQGTVAGSVTVTVNSLTDSNGNSVLPSPAPSQTITVPYGEPTLVGSPTMTVSASSVTVVVDAITTKRSVVGANYVFNPGSSQQITVSVSFTSGAYAGDDQSQWFATQASLATGGSFSLSATFPCTDCSSLSGVQVTLSN